MQEYHFWSEKGLDSENAFQEQQDKDAEAARQERKEAREKCKTEEGEKEEGKEIEALSTAAEQLTLDEIQDENAECLKKAAKLLITDSKDFGERERKF